MEEIYGLVEEAFRGGQDRVQLQAFPFQMTAENLVRHAEDPNAPFWEMLRQATMPFPQRACLRRLPSAISAMSSIRHLGARI